MCGITGFLSIERQATASQQALIAQVRAMADPLAPRGPDDEGAWSDPAAGIALGFRRLAIVDLSPAGRQPMASASGRYVLVFNGEIYNHAEIRRRLTAAYPTLAFRGHSDTEVLLAAIETWGLKQALEEAVGMFAIALWDRKQQTLSLARDRLGEKPLYYGVHNQTLLFASELKSLAVHPAFVDRIDREALALFLEFGYIPAPYSIYERIGKLPPGTLVELPAEALRHSPDHLPAPIAYWSAKEVVESATAARFTGSFGEAADELERRIKATIADQMVADVPVGAFLSGGIDSSLVVALAQIQSSRQVKTFTIGFHESGFNEAVYAKAVAQHLGTDHTELYVTPEEARAVIPSLPTIYDEPFADSSQIPTHLVSQLARQHVTVSLSGDGGDELFGGYTRYPLTTTMWKAMSAVPAPLRRRMARCLLATPPAMLDKLFFWLAPFADRHGAPARISGKLYRMADMLKHGTVEGFYRSIVSQSWPQGHVVAGELAGSRSIFDQPEHCAQLKHVFEKAMYLDLVTYLPDDILAKVDRAAMAVSLETRVPLLDHRLVEFAWRLPYQYKHRERRGKAILRHILDRHVPPALTHRRKMGFGVPIGEWLRGPLRSWAADLIGSRQLADDGWFDPAKVDSVWQQHLAGHRNRERELWAILMFQAWNQTRASVQSRQSAPRQKAA